MAIIDLSNYKDTLAQSTEGRSGNINGNVYFDTTNGKIEFLSAIEAPYINLTRAGNPTGTADVAAADIVADQYYMIKTVGDTDFTAIGADSNTVGLVFQATGSGSGSGTADECTANPLEKIDGIKFEAIYAFENQERARDEELRKFDRWTSGTFKFGGAYNFINGRTPSTENDIKIIRGSGWNEIDANGTVQKKYFGNKGLSNIYPSSQPYYQLGKYTTPIDFGKAGQIDEAILVYDYNGGSPIDNTKNPEIVSVRTYGNNYDRKATDIDLGIAELGGYSTGFAVNETPHLTTNPTTMPITDVYNSDASQQNGVWTNMTLEELDSALNRDEFVETAGTFTWVLNNPNNANLDQCIAYLDAIATVDSDINANANKTTNGKAVDTWYYYNAQGQVVTKSGADSKGLYIYNIPIADQQRVVFTDDNGDTKTYSFTVSVEANVGAVAKADDNAWYHSFFAANYNTANAVTVQDKDGNPVKGLASNANEDNKIIFGFDYTGDTVGGDANTDKNCVFLCEGDGGATQAKTLYTITRNTTIAFACAPTVENNV
jgi:hypothetical protein